MLALDEFHLPVIVPALLALFAEEGFPVMEDTGGRLADELAEGLAGGSWLILSVFGQPAVPPGAHLAGLVACQACDTLPLGPHLFIRYLFVYPAWRKTRAARMLLTHLARELVLRGFSEWLVVGASTGLLRRSYRKLGFLPLSQAGASKVSLVAEKLGVR